MVSQTLTVVRKSLFITSFLIFTFSSAAFAQYSESGSVVAGSGGTGAFAQGYKDNALAGNTNLGFGVTGPTIGVAPNVE